MPAWLPVLSRISLSLSLLGALAVLADIFVLRRRQPMRIMEAVWPLTMLYWGPFGLVFYVWFGRGPRDRAQNRVQNPVQHRAGPMWQSVFKGATHCGAGCALGDMFGDWLAFATGFALFGSFLGGKYLLAFVLAYLFGILFQYASIVPMKDLGIRDGLVAAVKIDTVSLLAYQLGMFAWMAFRAWRFPGLQPTNPTYWFMMQLAMLAGFATTCPVNWWLIRAGVKEAM